MRDGSPENITSPARGTPTRRPPPRSLRFSKLPMQLKRSLKWVGFAIGLTVAALPAAMSGLEALLSGREEVFLFWGQALALVPGLPGKYIRRCYYRLTLRSFALSSEVGFLSHFCHRDAEVGGRVFVGVGTNLGTVKIDEGALIGSRVSVLSGKSQHQLGPDGRLTPCGPNSLHLVRIGEETWIGEGSIIMADVGNRCIVAAGSVVSQPIPDGCLVGGNPARFARRIWPPPLDDSDGHAGTMK
jgi:virginiamycin A acetyltransferase